MPITERSRSLQVGRGWDLQGAVYSTQTTVWQPSKMLITINRQKDSRDFSPHYFSWSSRDSGSWKIWISKLEKQASTHGFKKILFLDITRPYNFRKSEKLLKFYQWKAKATSKALKFTVNRQSYHPTETVSVTLERVTHGIKFLTIKFMREGVVSKWCHLPHLKLFLPHLTMSLDLFTHSTKNY